MGFPTHLGKEAPVDQHRPALKHLVSTLAYRCSKSIDDAPSSFAGTRFGDDHWDASEILAHISDLMIWTRRMLDGDSSWVDRKRGDWDAEVTAFRASCDAVIERLDDGTAMQAEAHRLIQGPLADALTHVGQLASLRRVAGAPIGGESYFKADIAPFSG